MSMNEEIQRKLTSFFSDYQQKKYAKGELISRANQEIKYLSFLETGIVAQYDITNQGSRFIVNIFKPFTFFPMSSAINASPNPYFFEAISDVVVRRADAGSTVFFLKENPDVMLDLLSRVYKGTDMLLKRLVLASSGHASDRLILEILIEAYRFGIKTGNGVKLVSLKQSILAERSGLARETVSREVHKLKEYGLLSKTKSATVLDVNGLERLLSNETI
jgi:CRP-like cAMP-binding protein